MSTEHLRHLVQRNRYLFRERTQGEIVLKESDGRDVMIDDDYGKPVKAVLPDGDLDDFLRQGQVSEDPSSSGAGDVYRLTDKGRADAKI
jgi:hypothetical protein